ncbi:hypothetical protein [Rhodococcus jostii]|uniref:hypothetical protein n=1 Tax=Rhodococcus jostii TaxID=132919 RepID=UPI00362BE9E9
MTDVSRKKNRPDGMRRWAYVPLAVSVLAGAVCGGAGTGTAATTASTDVVTESATTPDAPHGSAGDKNWWSLYNYTGLPVYGEFSVQTGKAVSEVKIDKDRQLASGGHESRPTTNSVWWRDYWMGHICFNHAWYNFPRTDITIDQDATFALWNGKVGDVESGGRREGVPAAGVYATWNPRSSKDPSKANLIRNWAEAPC